MSTIISVYAKSGVSIPANRLVRLTGQRKDTLWEIDFPSASDQRAHAFAMPGPSGTITPTVFGQARTFGPLVEVDMATSVTVDDALVTGTDGRLSKAALTDKNRVAVSVETVTAGASGFVIFGWGQFP